MPVTQGLCRICDQPTFAESGVCYGCEDRQSVAVVGKMCAGKTTIAKHLMELGYSRVAHADALKEVAAMAYGPIDKSGYYGVTRPFDEAKAISGREVLQQVGENMKRLDRNFWLRIMLARAERVSQPVVNDDTRFPFEAEALSNHGFLIVKVSVPEPVRMARYERLYGRLPTEEEQSHESERYIDDIPYDLSFTGESDPKVTARSINAHAKRQLGA